MGKRTTVVVLNFGEEPAQHLILFKECLRNDIVPFIIRDEWKLYYYRGLHEWKRERGYLRDTCYWRSNRGRQIGLNFSRQR